MGEPYRKELCVIHNSSKLYKTGLCFRLTHPSSLLKCLMYDAYGMGVHCESLVSLHFFKKKIKIKIKIKISCYHLYNYSKVFIYTLKYAFFLVLWNLLCLMSLLFLSCRFWLVFLSTGSRVVQRVINRSCTRLQTSIVRCRL